MWRKLSELPFLTNVTSSFHERPGPYSGIKIEVHRLIEIRCLEKQVMDVFGRSTVPLKSVSWFPRALECWSDKMRPLKHAVRLMLILTQVSKSKDPSHKYVLQRSRLTFSLCQVGAHSQYEVLTSLARAGSRHKSRISFDFSR